MAKAISPKPQIGSVDPSKVRKRGKRLPAQVLTRRAEMYFKLLGAFIVATVWLIDTPSLVSAQTLPRDLKTWTLEYTAGGGIRARGMSLKLTQDGALNVSNISESNVRAHAPAELMTRIREFLKVAHQSRPTMPGPDQSYDELILTSAGVKYELAPESVRDLLSQTIDTVMNKEILGTWWESEWKLCQPAAQLTANQMDAPIESLVFQNDGHFSVTWRGGGARAYADPSGKTPHVSVPDYSGRYVISPDDGGIRMTFESGVHTPRDFSGDGGFQITEDKLVLSRVWLGTHSAKQKPDICEMTFKRSSEITPSH